MFDLRRATSEELYSLCFALSISFQSKCFPRNDLFSCSELLSAGTSVRANSPECFRVFMRRNNSLQAAKATKARMKFGRSPLFGSASELALLRELGLGISDAKARIFISLYCSIYRGTEGTADMPRDQRPKRQFLLPMKHRQRPETKPARGISGRRSGRRAVGTPAVSGSQSQHLRQMRQLILKWNYS